MLSSIKRCCNPMDRFTPRDRSMTIRHGVGGIIFGLLSFSIGIYLIAEHDQLARKAASYDPSVKEGSYGVASNAFLVLGITSTLLSLDIMSRASAKVGAYFGAKTEQQRRLEEPGTIQEVLVEGVQQGRQIIIV